MNERDALKKEIAEERAELEIARANKPNKSFSIVFIAIIVSLTLLLITSYFTITSIVEGIETIEVTLSEQASKLK